MQAPVILVAPEVAKKMILIIKLSSGRVKFIFLISFKVLLLFNITSADIKTKSADVVLKTTTILKEMRIAQLSS